MQEEFLLEIRESSTREGFYFLSEKICISKKNQHTETGAVRIACQSKIPLWFVLNNRKEYKLLCLRKELEKIQDMVLVSSSVTDLLWLWARKTISIELVSFLKETALSSIFLLSRVSSRFSTFSLPNIFHFALGLSSPLRTEKTLLLTEDGVIYSKFKVSLETLRLSWG